MELGVRYNGIAIELLLESGMGTAIDPGWELGYIIKDWYYDMSRDVIFNATDGTGIESWNLI